MATRWPRVVLLALVGTLFATLPTLVCAAPEEGKLVHVADTRHLTGFNLFVANLYNTDRLLFTLFALGVTAALGLTLGLLMDVLVGLIGLDLKHRGMRE